MVALQDSVDVTHAVPYAALGCPDMFPQQGSPVYQMCRISIRKHGLWYESAPRPPAAPRCKS